MFPHTNCIGSLVPYTSIIGQVVLPSRSFKLLRCTILTMYDSIDILIDDFAIIAVIHSSSMAITMVKIEQLKIAPVRTTAPHSSSGSGRIALNWMNGANAP